MLTSKTWKLRYACFSSLYIHGEILEPLMASLLGFFEASFKPSDYLVLEDVFYIQNKEEEL